MDFQTCGLVNGPLTVFNIIANMFFIFCMVCPLHGERFKQPLKLLLWSLISSTVGYMISNLMLYFPQVSIDNVGLLLASSLISLCSSFFSLTSSVWLNFYYFTQIVPTHRALFIWIKKHIKPIIYCILFAERIYILLDLAARLQNYFTLTNLASNGFIYNFTMYDDAMTLQIIEHELQTDGVLSSIRILYFTVCLCVMVMSSSSTVVYLCRHMRRMFANGQTLSCPQFSAQMRVATAGILQEVMYIFLAGWTLYSFTGSRFINICIHITAVNIYMSGTTFSLAAGQGVFRQRAADIWLRAAQRCKTPKAQQDDTEAQTRTTGH